MTDSEQQIAGVLSRLVALERQNRRLRAGLTAMAIGTASLFLVGAVLQPSASTIADTVSAHKFVLVDAKGRTRALLALVATKPWPDEVMTTTQAFGPQWPELGPGLALFDSKEQRRALLALNGNGHPGLVLSAATDDNSKASLILSAVLPELTMYDSKGIRRASLYLDGQEAPSLLMKADDRPLGLQLELGRTAEPGDQALLARWPFYDFGLQLNSPSLQALALGVTSKDDEHMHLRLADGTGPRLVLGATSLSLPDGGTMTTPTSSITALRGGRVVGQWPR